MFSHTDIQTFKSVLKPLVNCGTIKDEIFQVAVNALKEKLTGYSLPEAPGRDKLISRKEAAEILDCSIRTVIRLEETGKLKAIRYGGAAIKYKESDIMRLMNCYLDR